MVLLTKSYMCVYIYIYLYLYIYIKICLRGKMVWTDGLTAFSRLDGNRG